MAKSEASSVKWTSLLDRDYQPVQEMHREAVDIRLTTERWAVLGVCAVALHNFGTAAYLVATDSMPYETAAHIMTGLIGGILGGLALLRNANQQMDMLAGPR